MSSDITAQRTSDQAITTYQWLTLVSAFLGWAFDSMDLNLFTLVLVPSVSELTGARDPGAIAHIGGIILAIKLFCWGIGGIIFGVVADRVGRARTMIITIVIYAGFTGLSGLAQSWTQLAILQGLAGFGIGGEWAAGAALVAETWPERHRARAMQIMQMAFGIGFFFAAVANLFLGPISWRWVLAMGAAPAIVSLVIRHFVPEPERWLHARAKDEASGNTGALDTVRTIFGPELRRNTIVGVLVSSAMMIGCWGGLALLPNWISQLVRASGGANGVQIVSYAFMLMMVGATLGYLSLIWMTEAWGRRGAYFVFCLGALVSSVYLFGYVTQLNVLMWFMPVYGYFVIGGFGTFALYLPELFPTRVRATGQGFCWNMARSITAIGPLMVGTLLATFGSFQAAANATTVVYVIGLVAIWFGPETKGRPLED
ncbi:MAG: MFS transporter [Rhodoblastus sp.]